MSVLDAFVHDPLVEWEDELRRIVRFHHVGSPLDSASDACLQERKSAGNQPRDKDEAKKNKGSENTKEAEKKKEAERKKMLGIIKGLAKNALLPIGKKLQGIYVPNNVIERSEKAVTTSNLVQMLIQEATSPVNLVSDFVFNLLKR